jgi:hypothetical protein
MILIAQKEGMAIDGGRAVICMMIGCLELRIDRT